MDYSDSEERAIRTHVNTLFTLPINGTYQLQICTDDGNLLGVIARSMNKNMETKPDATD
jgi:hypothetical protein